MHTKKKRADKTDDMNSTGYNRVTDASAAVHVPMMMATAQWGARGGEPPLLLPCIAEGRHATSTHLVMEGRRSRSPRFLLPFFFMTTLALSASNASASCCITTQQQGKQVTKKRISAYRRHHDEHAHKQQDMGDGAGPQPARLAGIYAMTGKPYLVLRDTLCSCEAYGMRPTQKEKKIDSIETYRGEPLLKSLEERVSEELVTGRSGRGLISQRRL